MNPRAFTAVVLSMMLACAHPASNVPGPAPAPAAGKPAAPAEAAKPVVAVAATPASPSAPASAYDRPPQAVLDVLRAPPPPEPYLSPTADTMLLVSWVDYPPISQVAEPFLRLAGVRVEPRTRRKHDTPGGYGIAPCARRFVLVDVATTRETEVALPAGGCAAGVAWSADGKRFAFRNTSSEAVELWVGDVATGATHRIGELRLNPMLGSAVQWMADQRRLRLLLLSGYAIIDNAAFPIVGDPRKAYDTYLEQLAEDARAAVDKAVELGVVDRERIGVTGHSHGALMTVNLLAHTDLFRAGVATSGGYNKTLVPFGFQSERRSVWKAQDVYLKVSPFFAADKLKLPLLLIHGMDDANPGTRPEQSAELYKAIRGNGGTARLVMLPHEPHWYAAMESNEQLAYEELRWFDKYVKNAPARERGAPATDRSVAPTAPAARRGTRDATGSGR